MDFTTPTEGRCVTQQHEFLYEASSVKTVIPRIPGALIIHLLLCKATSDQSYATRHVWWYYDLCVAKFQRPLLIKVQRGNPHTRVKLRDNLMTHILKWSRRLHFRVIWKKLLCGVLAETKMYSAWWLIAYWISEKTGRTHYWEWIETAGSYKPSLIHFQFVFIITENINT